MKLSSIQSLNSILGKLMAIALVLTISACASNKNSEDDPEGDAATSNALVSTQGADEGDVKTVSNKDANSLSASESVMSAGEQRQLLKQREIFFGFDSFGVVGSDRKAMIAHGKFLAKTPTARVRLEGHTDERGTREYNLALGERRAKAAQQVLLSAGAQSRQIEVITFGEERPKAQGSNEAAYKQNRRVDIKYTVGQP